MNDCLYLLKAEDTDAVLSGQGSDHDLVTLRPIHTISGRFIMSVSRSQQALSPDRSHTDAETNERWSLIVSLLPWIRRTLISESGWYTRVLHKETKGLKHQKGDKNLKYIMISYV